MKLLFDHNLSDRLVSALAGTYPGSMHVRQVGLASASDEAIWQFAKQQAAVITSKDSDFYYRSTLFGHPPKVIWIRLGNCTTDQVEALLRARTSELAAFENDAAASFLMLR